MPTVLFALSPALHPSKPCFPSLTTCHPRRPRTTVITASSSPTPPSDPNDPSWRQLARSLGSSDPTPPRPPPDWKETNDGSSSQSEEATAWANWQSAREEQPEVAERNPKKETDFWRSTARELTQPTQATNATKPVTDDTTQKEIWSLARGVTGEMSELQDRLRADLDKFNPEENSDQYRRIARELIGPQEDDWEIKSEENVLQRPDAGDWGGASSASGWNPNTDWRRFDDIRREEVLKREKEAREEAAREAQQEREKAYERLDREANAQADGNITYTDESGRVLSSDEVKRALEEGAVFVDEAGKEIGTEGGRKLQFEGPKQTNGADKFGPGAGSFESGKMPGFVVNRFRSKGTYGASYAGAEEYMKELQEKGIPLRDPKADSESWREAARELNFEVELDPLELTGSEDKSGENTDNSTEAVEVGSKNENTAFDETVERVDGDDTEAEALSSWSKWRDGNLIWEKATADAAPRDPKQEVDMWRSSAREIVSDIETSSGAGKAPDSSSAAHSSNKEVSAWSVWRNASARWESTLQDANGDLQKQDSANVWNSQGNQGDRGSSTSGNASPVSERSAWEDWNSTKGKGKDVQNGFWWSTATNPKSRAASNTEQWKKAASELVKDLGVTSKAGDSTESGGSRAEREESINHQSEAGSKDATLNFWRGIAKDMSEPE